MFQIITTEHKSRKTHKYKYMVTAIHSNIVTRFMCEITQIQQYPTLLPFLPSFPNNTYIVIYIYTHTPQQNVFITCSS